MTKAQLRKEVDLKRRALKPEWVASASRRIVELLQSTPDFQQADSIALYKAIAGEVELEALFTTCWEQGKRTSIPVFNAAERTYELTAITRKTRFKTGHYGIQEPETVSRIPVESLDLMIVPGVAFDAAGNRLGRGGGYYDRLLHGFPGTALAVAFDFQVYPHIPYGAHDVPVDGIVTEIKVMNVQNEH